VPECKTRPFLMVWGLVLASADEGMASVVSSGVVDIAQVGWITTILKLSSVLSYPSVCIILSQSSVAIGHI
jgi:hypothetical protein